MIMVILEALASSLIGFLAKWLEKRHAQHAIVHQQQAQAEATRGAESAEIQVEQARQTNEQTVDAVRADAADTDGLRKQSIDVNAAIAAANRNVQ